MNTSSFALFSYLPAVLRYRIWEALPSTEFTKNKENTGGYKKYLRAAIQYAQTQRKRLGK